MASKAPVDWTQLPQTFGHEVWSFGLVFGDGFSAGSHEMRASSDGAVERRHKDLNSGDEVSKPMSGRSKEEVLAFYEKRIMKAWERVGVVKNSRLNRADAKKSETLVVRRGVQKWNWQFLADQPPAEVKELYELVKEFFAPWSESDANLKGQEKVKARPVLQALEAEGTGFKSQQDLLAAARDMSEALQQLNQVIDDD